MKKKLVGLLLALALCLSIPAIASEEMNTPTDVPDSDRLYTAEEVALALMNVSSKGSRAKAQASILEDVLLPASMDIDIPHINMEKVVKEVRIATLAPEFQEELVAHGVEMTEDMTFSEYERIENTWLLSEETVKIAKILYSELADIDISKWTYGQFQEYYTNRDREKLIGRFTLAQKDELDRRGVQTSDYMYLFKEYHTTENILRQTDEALKETIEGYYQFALDQVMASITRADPPKELYTEVTMPLYGTDFFLNDVLTTKYWRAKQIRRTLKAQQVLYNSTSTDLKCTNLYGTYSQSQCGAHEGIDFTCPEGTAKPTINAIFDGVKLKTSTTHQLSVYDKDSPDEPKTYTYLHMSSITAGDNITAGDAVGKQGKEGNAKGYHVHFEVHLGKTTSLSSGQDHALGSVSPYRIQDYIGEWDGDLGEGWEELSS